MPSEFTASERHHVHAWLDILLLRASPPSKLTKTFFVSNRVDYKLEDKEKVRL